ncbi:MAG: hypothetical protein MMC33_008307 [Icmadophila ericetorum]|nr:hypothetical protein [Icmadophila ericetorum]
MEDEDSDQSWRPEFLKPSKKTPDERTHLLPKPSDEENGEYLDLDGKTPGWRLILDEFIILTKDSVPVILAYILQNSLQTISVVIVGQASPEDLASAAFAYMFAMCTAWLIALGGTTAMDTLGSASFTGSSDPHDLGVILQRAFIVLGLFYIPVCILWIFSEPLFLALGQDPQISRDSSRFLMCLIPGGLGYIYLEAMKKYLQAQEIMRPGTYVLLIVCPVSAGLNYLFCYTLKFGHLGAPIATGISYWLAFFLLLTYTRYVQGWQGWGGWSRKCLSNMGVFAKLSFLGIIHVGTEWWAFEIVALAAGRLGTIPLAAQSVIMTSDQVMNCIPFGVGVATSGRVGNLLGAKRAGAAARAANTAAWLSMIFGAAVLAVLMLAKDHFAKIFNGDEAVVQLTAEVLPFVALFQIADGLNGSCGGSLRGMGRQHIGAAVNIFSYYCGALPLGIYLAFHGWGLKGLWVGQCIALYLVGALEWIIVAWSDWDYQVIKAFERMDDSPTVNEGEGSASSTTLDDTTVE